AVPRFGKVIHITGAGVTSHRAWNRKNVDFASEPATVKSNHLRHTLRRIGAPHLALAAIAVFAAGVLPACVPGMCCPVSPSVPTVHAQMPCCAPSDTFVPKDDTRQQPASFAGSTSLLPQKWAPVAVVTRLGAGFAPARVQTTHDTVIQAHPEPSPPLFLLNAQFLI